MAPTYLITSRPAGYKRSFFRTEEFPHYELLAFDDDKVEEFINHWYDSRIKDKKEAESRKDSIRKALDDNDRIKLLARNPLLLTIIALIHRYQAALPKERYMTHASHQNRWLDYTGEQYKGAYNLFLSLVNQATINNTDVENSIIALDKLGFNTIPFSISFDDDSQEIVKFTRCRDVINHVSTWI